MDEMISFGAGVNSVAMVILLAQDGWRGPVVFCDPGSEHPETYCYLETFERGFMADHGLELTRILPGSEYHEQSDLDLYDFCMEQGIIPLLAVRWCSVKWKRNPLENWRKAHGIPVTLLGITDDEPRRVRQNPTVRYPLVERSINRLECYRIIQCAGLDLPRKSGCFFCPGQALAQWRDLYLNYPDLFQSAIALEENASERCQKHATIDPHGVKLVDMASRRWEGAEQMDLSDWLPCACAL